MMELYLSAIIQNTSTTCKNFRKFQKISKKTRKSILRKNDVSSKIEYKQTAKKNLRRNSSKIFFGKFCARRLYFLKFSSKNFFEKRFSKNFSSKKVCHGPNNFSNQTGCVIAHLKALLIPFTNLKAKLKLTTRKKSYGHFSGSTHFQQNQRKKFP